MDFSVRGDPERLSHILDILLRILPQCFFILGIPNLTDLPTIQPRLQLIQTPRQVRLDKLLHVCQRLIHLAQPRRLLGCPDLLLRAEDCSRQILRLHTLGRQTRAVCVDRHIVGLLRPLQTQQCLSEIPCALEAFGVLQSIQVDCGAGVMFGIGPFLELEARDGAVGEEGGIARILEDAT